MSDDRRRQLVLLAAAGAAAIASAGVAFYMWRRSACETSGEEEKTQEKEDASEDAATSKAAAGAEEAQEEESPPVAAQSAPAKSEEEARAVYKAEWSKGTAKFKADDYATALTHFQAALANRPSSTEDRDVQVLLFNCAVCSERLKRFEAMERFCTQALEIDPLYAKALLRRGRARVQLNNLQAALEDMMFAHLLKDEGQEMSSEMMDVLRRLSREKASSTFKDLLEGSASRWHMPPRYARSFQEFVWGGGAPHDAKETGSLDECRKAHEEAPADELALLRLARALRRELMHEEALELLTSKRTMLTAEGLAEMGILLHFKGDLLGARRCFREAVDRNYAEAITYQACVEEDMGNTETALRLLDQAQAKGASLGFVHFYRGSTMFLGNKFDQAAEEFEKCLKVAPGFTMARLQLAATKFKMKRQQEATKLLEEAVQQAPQVPEVLNYQGEMLMMLGDTETARSRFEEARKLDRTCPLPLINLALVSMAPSPSGAPDAESVATAERLFTQALELDSQFMNAYQRLAEVRMMAGDYDGAKQYFDKATRYARTMADMQDVLESSLVFEAQQTALQRLMAARGVSGR